METERVAEEVQRRAAMDCRGHRAQALAKRIEPGKARRLLDVAGGSGIYACALAAHFHDLGGSVKAACRQHRQAGHRGQGLSLAH